MSLSDDLKGDGYILFTKKQFWGAFAAVLAVTGSTAWGAAKAAVLFGAEKVAANEIRTLRVQAEQHATEIDQLHATARRIVTEMTQGSFPNISTSSLSIVNAAGVVVGTLKHDELGSARLVLSDAKGIMRCEASTSKEESFSLMLYSHKEKGALGLTAFSDGDLFVRKYGADKNVSHIWP